MAGFPVFLELDRIPPLIIGGGELAAIKALLVLEQAKRVTFAADHVCGAIEALIADGRADRISAEPGVRAIKGRPLVISVSGDDAEDKRVSLIAREFGVPVNVPGRKELSTFSLAATDGGFPGALASNENERDGQNRDQTPAQSQAAAQVRDHGRVFLVGAGPGDRELLTLKAVRALKAADVILTDFLVGEGVLEHARRDVQIISVGKAKGRHSKTQAEINAMIVAFARDGKTVVRLKGGDPFVFGRGGEEVDILRASGIACEVVPGITAATAAASSLQIPLTHRDISRSVTFISGHAAGDGAPEFGHVDFKALAGGQNTLAIYMGVATAGVLAEQLLSSGWSPATPIMAVERASHAGERRVATTLDVLADDPSRLGLNGPAVLICGEVAGLTPNGHVEHVARRQINTQSNAFNDQSKEVSHV